MNMPQDFKTSGLFASTTSMPLPAFPSQKYNQSEFVTDGSDTRAMYQCTRSENADCSDTPFTCSHFPDLHTKCTPPVDGVFGCLCGLCTPISYLGNFHYSVVNWCAKDASCWVTQTYSDKACQKAESNGIADWQVT